MSIILPDRHAIFGDQWVTQWETHNQAQTLLGYTMTQKWTPWAPASGGGFYTYYDTATYTNTTWNTHMTYRFTPIYTEGG